MKTVVVYTSKTGFTKKYAEWIAEELECDVRELKGLTAGRLSEYDCIIYGGGLMAGKVGGFDKVKLLANLDSFGGDDVKDGGERHFILFATGSTPQDMPGTVEKIEADNVCDGEAVEKIFYFEGGLDYENMGFMGRSMIKMMRKTVLKKKDITEEEKWLMSRIEKSYDGTNRDYIKPLVEYVKELA